MLHAIRLWARHILQAGIGLYFRLTLPGALCRYVCVRQADARLFAERIPRQSFRMADANHIGGYRADWIDAARRVDGSNGTD